VIWANAGVQMAAMNEVMSRDRMAPFLVEFPGNWQAISSRSRAKAEFGQTSSSIALPDFRQFNQFWLSKIETGRTLSRIVRSCRPDEMPNQSLQYVSHSLEMNHASFSRQE
jgi:hypothetical protein